MLPDYYSILRIAVDAEAAEIKAAYRRRVKACHPDRGGRHRDMVLVNAAWEILGDEDRRRQYDAARTSAESPPPVSVPAKESVVPGRPTDWAKLWTKFDDWRRTLPEDIRAVEWTTFTLVGMKFPEPRRSASAKAFVIASAAVCALGAIVYGLIALRLNWFPSKTRVDQAFFSTAWLALLASCGGAWLGKWLHRQVGRWLVNRDRKI